MLVSGPLNQRSHFVPTRSANRWDREFQESMRIRTPLYWMAWGQYLEVRAVCAFVVATRPRFTPSSASTAPAPFLPPLHRFGWTHSASRRDSIPLRRFLGGHDADDLRSIAHWKCRVYQRSWTRTKDRQRLYRGTKTSCTSSEHGGAAMVPVLYPRGGGGDAGRAQCVSGS